MLGTMFLIIAGIVVFVMMFNATMALASFIGRISGAQARSARRYPASAALMRGLPIPSDTEDDLR